MTESESIKIIADKLSNIKFIDIETRPITKEDLKINNNQVIRIKHQKGFDIQIRNGYVVELFCNIPTLMYSVDKFIVADDLLGKHPVEFVAEDMVIYVNGLLGYDVNK